MTRYAGLVVLAAMLAAVQAQFFYIPGGGSQPQQQQQQPQMQDQQDQQPQGQPQQQSQQFIQPAPIFLQQPNGPVVSPILQAVPAPQPRIYSYIPPSPLAPPCPPGYTCCGNFKNFDPSGSKKCCGDRAYTPSLQSCAGGMVVTIIQASNPPTTTPLPVYVQRVELICEGVKWQVPFPNYQCCGPSVYNVRSEWCSNGIVNSPDDYDSAAAPAPAASPVAGAPLFPAPAPAKASAPATTTAAAAAAATTQMLVCQGVRYTVPSTDFQFYACCGFQAYFWIREQCVNGQISPPRPSTTTTSSTPIAVPVLIVCDTTQHWVTATDRSYYGCCGTDLYDIRVETCRAPLSPSGSSGSASNGGGSAATTTTASSQSSCPANFICCESFPAVDNSNGNLQCCPGVGPYDPNVSNCPSASG